MNNNKGEVPIALDPFSVEADKEEDGGLDEVWIKMAAQLLREKPSERSNKVASFRQAIASDHELCNRLGLGGETIKEGSEGLLVRFLRAGLWEVDEAMVVLKSYCSLGDEYQQYIDRAIPSKLERVWSHKLNTINERRDNHGRRVYIFRLGQWDPDTVPVEEYFASAYVLLELVTREVKTQIAGITVIADVSGFAFKHIRTMGIEQIKCVAAFLCGSFPLWFHKIHIIHHPRIFNILYNMIKPFLNDRVRHNILFHGSDLPSLHQEVPPVLLPEDLGGSGDLDNSSVVGVAKQLDSHYRELISLSKMDLQRG